MGMAEYVATQPAAFTDVPVDSHAAGHVLDVRRALPTTARWGLDPDADYLIARAAVSYLVDAYGVERVIDLAKAYRRIPSDDPDQKTDQVLRQELDLSEADLVAATWDLLAGALVRRGLADAGTPPPASAPSNRPHDRTGSVGRRQRDAGERRASVAGPRRGERRRC